MIIGFIEVVALLGAGYALHYFQTPILEWIKSKTSKP